MIENVSHESMKKLETYIQLITKWNKSINLISSFSESTIWERHIADSLQLKDFLIDKSQIFDFGSGAGLPGIPLAILGIKNIHLVELDVRKCAFLRNVSSILELGVTIHNMSVEQLKLEPQDCIISRALCSVTKFCRYLSKFNGQCILLKGQRYEQELEEAAKVWRYEYELYPSITNKDSVILKLFNVQKI
jgi:16S rRNA (guanine527-N7)-methyltransferase